jgi:hypothetical protein
MPRNAGPIHGKGLNLEPHVSVVQHQVVETEGLESATARYED